MMPPVSDPNAPPPRRPAVFFDRDNTLIVADDYLGDPEKVVLVDGAAACVAGARNLGFAVVVVSNQSGVARGYYTEADVRAVDARLDGLLWAADRGAKIDHHDFCPHHPTHGVAPYRADCDCRKPKDGMLRRSAETLGIDLSQSWCVGDAPRDVQAGRSAGCRTILLSVPGLAPSPAASGESGVEPDFKAASLDEVLDILTRETNKATASTEPPAESVAEPVADAAAAAEGPAVVQAPDEAVADVPADVFEETNEADPAAAFDATFYEGRRRASPPAETEQEPVQAAADEEPAVVELAEPARPKVIIGSRVGSAAAMSPAARKAAASGAAAASPEALRASVDERARRLRERFGAIRSQSAAGESAEPAGEPDEPAAATPAPPRSAAPEVNLVKVATEAATAAASTAARSATDAAVDKLRRERDAHADDFSLLRLFAGVAQMLALGALVWALAADLNQGRLLLAIFLQGLALTLVMGSRSGV